MTQNKLYHIDFITTAPQNLMHAQWNTVYCANDFFSWFCHDTKPIEKMVDVREIVISCEDEWKVISMIYCENVEVKLCLCLTKHHAIKTCVGVESSFKHS